MGYRRKAFRLYGRECNRCNSDGPYEVHHKDRDNRNHDADNLEVLCLECHRIEHKSEFNVDHVHNRWTEQEIEVLRSNYPGNGATLDGLPRRSKNAIHQKAAELSLTTPRREWEGWELDLLEELYPIHGTRIGEIDRTRQAIGQKARELGLHFDPRLSKTVVRPIR